MSEEEESQPTDRINVALTKDASAAMVRLQESTGLKKVELTNRALLVYAFIIQEQQEGATVYLKEQDGQMVKVKLL